MGAIESVSTPIFQSVEDALFVSFLLGTLPVRGGSTQLQRMIEQAMREAGRFSGPEPGRISFGGLSPLEVRGQCSMIVAYVRDHLAAHESAAVHARYAYQAEKAAGVRGVVSYAEALLSIGHPDARLAMGWAVFGTERQRKDFNAAAIGREWGVPAKTAARDIATIKQTSRRLLDAAVDRIYGAFRESGVC